MNKLLHLVQQRDFVAWTIYLVASIAIACLCKLTLKLVSKGLRKWTRKTTSQWDDILVDSIDCLRPSFLAAWVFYFFLKYYKIQDVLQHVVRVIVVVLTAYQVTLWSFRMIRAWRDNKLKKRIEKDISSAATLNMLYIALKATVACTIFLMTLSHLGVNVGALVAGLGVGGIAVALAAQNILGDLLGSLSIVLDKPFVVGDFIIVGPELGTVEYIGIKTTRVRSLSGEQLIFSNKDLLESRIHNMQRLKERRIAHKYSVPYSTPVGLIEKIPGWIQEAVGQLPEFRFERCHLFGYGTYSFDFEHIFWVKSADYNLYMEAQQKLLLSIIRKFNSEGISFAVPSQELFVTENATKQANVSDRKAEGESLRRPN
jgi:small-conductance mechanosensitive channel